jgi:hypothetical protein
LDEYPSGNKERENLLDTLCDIHARELSNLHIFCTSRRELDIEAAFKPLLKGSGHIDIKSEAKKRLIEKAEGM